MDADTSGVNLNVANSLPSAKAEEAASAPATVIALDQEELDLLEECMDTAIVEDEMQDFQHELLSEVDEPPAETPVT
eukprot:2553649-Rhodomonas_salina.1